METLALEGISEKDINEMEERRINTLKEAGIDEEEVLTTAQDNLNCWQSYFNENITRGRDDMNFCLRDQWTAIERSEFSRLFKPPMTFNKIYPEVKKIIGEQRKNKPDLIVRSLTGKASQEEINLRSDLLRSIAYKSQNDIVYQTAFKSALLMGYGAYQIKLGYKSPRSFDKIISYEIIQDCTQTAFDPSAIKPHKGDGNFCSRNYIYSKEEFFATYPYILNPVSYTDARTLLDFQWQTRDTIAVCDYSVKEWYPLIIYKLSNGDVVSEHEWKEMTKLIKEKKAIVKGSEIESIALRDLPRIVSERQTQDYRIMQYRLTQNQIIDFSVWPSRHLPIIFVDSDSYYIDGRQQTKSFIHEARDAQKCINFFGSEIAAEVKNRRREQWMATPDNIAGYEQQWRNPELQIGALICKPDPKTGMMPAKMAPWELSPTLMQNMMRANQDMREILGMSEADTLGSRDISGKAKRERKLEVSMSSYVCFDNLNQAIEQGGRVVNDLLPYIIGDEERSMVVTKKDGQSQNITLNKRESDDSISNMLTKGEFEVEIDTGPSFAVQKEVALEMFQQTLQAYPQAFPLIADLWAANLDIQWMPMIKERFKNLVPPEVLAKEAGEPPPPPKPNPQQMMMQAEMAEKQASIQAKQAEIQVKMQKLALEQEQNELNKAKLLLDAQKVKTESELNIFDHRLNLEQAKVTHHLDHKKVDLDHKAKIAAIVADIYKHNNPHETVRSAE